MRSWQGFRTLGFLMMSKMIGASEMKTCECGYHWPTVEGVATQPNPSGLDVVNFGVILQCPKCARQTFIEFKPIRELAVSMPGDSLKEHIQEHNKTGIGITKMK